MSDAVRSFPEHGGERRKDFSGFDAWFEGSGPCEVRKVDDLGSGDPPSDQIGGTRVARPDAMIEAIGLGSTIGRQDWERCFGCNEAGIGSQRCAPPHPACLYPVDLRAGSSGWQLREVGGWEEDEPEKGGADAAGDGGGKEEGVAGSSDAAPKTPATLFENQFPKDTLGVPRLIPETKLIHGAGTYNYVVMEDGTLRIGAKTNSVGGGHIDLACGNPVVAAGVVKMVRGQVKWIDNSSGHYLPFGITAQLAAERAFRQRGFSLAENQYIEKAWVPDPTTPNGGRWRPK